MRTSLVLSMLLIAAGCFTPPSTCETGCDDAGASGGGGGADGGGSAGGGSAGGGSEGGGSAGGGSEGGGSAGGGSVGGGSAGGGSVGGGSAGGGSVGGGSAGGGSVGGGSAGGGSAGGGSAGGGSGTCTEGASCKVGAASGLCCDGTCRVTASDAANCGACGVRCPNGASCSNYSCSQSCTSAGVTCPAGTSCAAYTGAPGLCLPTSCGGLPSGRQCATASGGRGSCCGGACVALNTVANCGQCGRACGAGQICDGSQCVTGAANCSAAKVGALCGLGDGGAGQCCGGACKKLDIFNDPANCGECGATCPTGAACVNRQCRLPDAGFLIDCNQSCPAGTTCSTGSSCVRTACGGGSSLDERCGSTAAWGGCCGGPDCVSRATSEQHCGQCGRACAAGQFCANGTCAAIPSCGPANTGKPCPLAGGDNGICCGNACVDAKVTAAHCGQCNEACAPGLSCEQGRCLGSDGGQAYCKASPSSVWPECPPTTTCNGMRCVPIQCPAGATGGSCAFGVSVGSSASARFGQCCGGRCTDTKQDATACGQCGAACPAGSLCAGEFGYPQCLSPMPSNNCASCPAGSFCVNGQCASAACNASGMSCLASSGKVGLCCSSGFSTTCAAIADDVNNCGGCGVRCPTGASCMGGVCRGGPGVCERGDIGRYCAGDGGTAELCCPGAGCVDRLVSNSNCGYCGNVCAAGASCINGACLVSSCTPSTEKAACVLAAGGIGQCCGSACTTVANDSSNCGACGRKCSTAEVCRVGQCGMEVCTSSGIGAACHRDAGYPTGLCCAQGCTDGRSDPNNCGACNRQCPTGSSCVSGNCL